MWDGVIGAFVLGLIGGSVPGPVLTAILTEVFRMGFAKSLRVIVWGLIAETMIASMVLTAAFLINPPQSFFYAISFVGAVFLFYMAWKVHGLKKMMGKRERLFTFSKIFMLTFFNGAFFIFWTTICVPLAFQMRLVTEWGPLFFLLGFETGWFLSTIVWAYLFSHFRRFLTRPNFAPRVFTVMALVLCFFAIRMIVQGVRFFAS